MFNSALMGLVVLLVAVFLFPAILLAASQKMSGKKVNLDGYTRQVVRLIRGFIFAVVSMCRSAGKSAADRVPKQHARWRPLVRFAVTVMLVSVLALVALSALSSLAPALPLPYDAQDHNCPPELAEPGPHPELVEPRDIWVAPYLR